MEDRSKGDGKIQLFSEGDVFYYFHEDQYHCFKLLNVEPVLGIYHVLIYFPVYDLPAPEKVGDLETFIYHSPIAIDGFREAKLLAKTKVADGEWIGYYTYLRQTENFDKLISIAQGHFREGYRLTDEKKQEEAIVAYSRAIEALPEFYEAIDNRAFCKMDLARWEEAIKDFELSLSVEPKGIAAIFSIGECHLRLGNHQKAIAQFEEALRIEPGHALSERFLRKAKEMEAKKG